ncbi:MAG: TIGR01777 family oxidoreductase [Myxococcales bacterium]|nr:TIGR01777 family oxidoreductase [Myxococcales bacterium]MDH3484657.1 TIGR01777 family oxidoreductase [Myxococcales bacterium]
MAEREKIAVTGASGLVGKALVPALRANGFDVIRLVRRSAKSSDEVRWDPDAGAIDADALRGVCGAIHLAGDNIAEGRWTEAKKVRIRNSRVHGTTLIAGALAELAPKPRVLISASAIGYYGNRGDETLDERAAAGSGFLAEVCREWEDATRAAEEAGIRVVNARIGIVLASEGGALAKMRTPFALGVGGRIGDGTQYMSWIALEDLVSGLLFALQRTDLRGPVNFVSPDPVTNAYFTKTLARTLKRPAVIPVPKFALRLGLGSEMADEMLIGGARVIPAALHASEFVWEYTTLEAALGSLL